MQRIVLLHLAIPILILLAYISVWQHEFVWDDVEYVVENPHLTPLNADTLQWMLTGFHSMNWHPLTWLSLGVDKTAVGLEPARYHGVNVLLHAANSLWVFWLTLSFLTLRRWQDSGTRWLAAVIAALLFGLHPLHVESVAWVTERKDVLCLFFLLPATISYLLFAQTRYVYWYGLAAACFILALLSKPLAITWPVLMLLLDAYPLRRNDLGTMLYEKLPLFALSLGAIGLTLMAQTQAINLAVPLEQRLFNAAYAALFYLAQWLFPVNLSPFYPLLDRGPEALVIVIAISLVGLYAFLRAEKQRRWLIVWVFYLVALAPMLGIIQVGSQAAADRYVYWPIVGIHILFVVLCIEIWRRLSRFRVIEIAVAAGMLMLLISLSFLTHQQSLVWRNEISLWQRAVDYAPNTLRTQNNLAAAYLQAGDYQQAIEHYRLLTIMFPDHTDSHYFLADAYWQASQWQQAELEYSYILNLQPDSRLPAVYTRLGEIARYRGTFERAKEWATAALTLLPDYPPALKLQQDLAQF